MWVEDDEGHFAPGEDTRRLRRRDAVFDFCGSYGARRPGCRDSRRQPLCVGDQSFDRRLSDEMGTAVRIEGAQRCRVIDICQDGAEPGAKWLKFLTQERDMFAA